MGQMCCHSALKMLKKSILPVKSIDFGYINPRGIYSNEISYDLNIVKHMIRKGRLAPFYDGQSEPCKSKDNLVYDVECPICFLYYPSELNRTRCCDKSICTECFIQLQTSAVCPFCVQSHFGVFYIPPIWSISFKKKRSDLLLNHSVNKKHWKVEPNDPNVILPIDIRRATGTRLQRCLSSLNHNNTDILILETI